MIGITGASGQLGSGILKLLVGKIPPKDIVAVTRTPAKVAAFSAQGATIRTGDFDVPGGLLPAFRGIEKLLIIPTSDLRTGVRRKQHCAAVRAAVGAGVHHIIYLSTVGARPGPDLFDTHFSTEMALFELATVWTVIRMSLYADNLLAVLPRAVTSGTYAAPDAAPVAYVSRDNVAALAAGILATPGHENVTYYATGPRAVTQEEVAAAAAKASGRPVSHVPITPEQLRQGLVEAGLSAGAIRVYLDIQEAMRTGAFDMVSGDMARLAGRPAESLDAFLDRNSKVLTPAP